MRKRRNEGMQKNHPGREPPEPEWNSNETVVTREISVIATKIRNDWRKWLLQVHLHDPWDSAPRFDHLLWFVLCCFFVSFAVSCFNCSVNQSHSSVLFQLCFDRFCVQSQTGTAVSLDQKQNKVEIVDLVNMRDFTNQLQSIVSIDEPLFEPSPREIVFDHFEPFETYTLELTLRNKDNVCRCYAAVSSDHGDSPPHTTTTTTTTTHPPTAFLPSPFFRFPSPFLPILFHFPTPFSFPLFPLLRRRFMCLVIVFLFTLPNHPSSSFLLFSFFPLTSSSCVVVEGHLAALAQLPCLNIWCLSCSFSSLFSPLFFFLCFQVPRRVLVQPPESSFLFLSAPRYPNKKRTAASSSSSSSAPVANLASTSPVSSSTSSPPSHSHQQQQQQQSGRVPSGLAISYTLTFKPQQKKDYFFNLLCVTEREKFYVPVRALGERGKKEGDDDAEWSWGRRRCEADRNRGNSKSFEAWSVFHPLPLPSLYHPLLSISSFCLLFSCIFFVSVACLEFPGTIFFPSAPVKYPSSRACMLRNIGPKSTKFVFAMTEPFSVSPREGYVQAQESVQIVVAFNPQVNQTDKQTDGKRVGKESVQCVVSFHSPEIMGVLCRLPCCSLVAIALSPSWLFVFSFFLFSFLLFSRLLASMNLTYNSQMQMDKHYSRVFVDWVKMWMWGWKAPIYFFHRPSLILYHKRK